MPGRTDVRNGRDFRLFWLGGAATALGSHASALVLPVLALVLGASPVAAGLLGTAVGVTEVVAAPVAGVYADRLPRRSMMVVSALGAAVAAAVIAVAVLAHRASLPVLFAAGIAEGAAIACYGAAASGAILAILPRDAPESALSAVQAREKAAQLAGPGIGGGVYQSAPWAPFFVHAVFYLGAALCARALGSDLRPVRTETTRTAFVKDFAEGVRFLWGRPFLRFMTVWAAGVNLVLGAVYFQVVLVARLHGASAAAIGVLLTAAGAAGLGGALAAPALLRRFPPIRVVLVFSWLMAVLALLFAATPPLPVAGVLLAVLSAVTPALGIVFQTRAITGTPDGMQARVGTALGALGEGTSAVAPLLAGALVTVLTPALVAVVLGAGFVAIAGYTSVAVPAPAAIPVRTSEPAEE